MKVLRISIILTSSLALLLIPKPLVNACGFTVFPGEYRFWLLQPDLTNERDLTPFFFAGNYLYKGTDTTAVETYPQRNIDEWLERVGKDGVGRKDIDILLNHTEPDLFFERADSLARTNSFVRYLLRKGNDEWYRYMRLSKKVEQMAAHPDPWEEGPIPQVNVGKVIEEAKTLYRQAGSDFIKFRTTFQLMRLYHFNGSAAEVRRVYEERIARVSSASWIKSAAMYLEATHGDEPETDRLFAKVFDRGDYNRTHCLMFIRSANVDSLVQHTRDGHERVVLQAMAVFNYPGRALSAIQKIYAAEPGYREIPFLLLREINKIEDWLVTSKVTGFQPAVYNATYFWQEDGEASANYNQSNWLADRAYASRCGQFIQRLIEDKKSTQPALLHLYSAHLSMLTGDYKTAGEQLQAAGAYKHLPRNLRSQIAINRFLLQLENQPVDASLEKNFLSLIREPAEQLGIYDADIMKDQLVLYTARKMIKKGNKAKGLMLLSRTRRTLGTLPIPSYKDVYQEISEAAAPADFDSMIAILDRTDKTPFEKFITTGIFRSPKEYYDWSDSLVWDRNRLQDMKASWYLRNNDLDAAVQVLHKIPDSFWRREPYKDYIGGNPFFLNIYKAGHYYGKRNVSYNKRTIVEKMLELRSIAATTPSKRAECYFQLANAWYNMSYYGNNWLMVKRWWSVDELGDDVPTERSGFNDNYYGCGRAKEFYLQAMRETHDKKLAALCCFMAGQCEENRRDYIRLTRPPNKRGAEVYFANPYLAELKDKHYYEELVDECAVYNDYIRTFDRAL
ncbi:MAG TPA: hypothetical protein VI233_08340 [Puia sp.]